MKLTPTARAWVGPSSPGCDEIVTHVDVTWAAEGATLDRPSTGGWQFSASKGQQALAARLARAINDGVLLTNAKMVRDNSGQTYVQYDRPLGKYANSTLRALGY